MTIQLKKILFVLWILLFSAALSGCSTIHFYAQAIQGQCRILLKRQPISELLADPDSPEFLRQRLTYILSIREFAKTELQLPVESHYLTYVDLERSFVAWNVFAAPEFSLALKTWCYPIAGCAAYRGYFSEYDALRYAETLENQGYDVYVGGVTAYSTLGWFNDPVLNTFIRLSKAHTAALIFHELAHQVLYVPDDTAFNESFATLVEQEGLRRWRQVSNDLPEYNEHLNHYSLRLQLIKLIMRYRKKLELIYPQDITSSEKREKKLIVFSDLRKEFNILKSQRIELSIYDTWMNRPLNNAKIGSIIAYHDFVPAFRKILTTNNGDMNQFYEICRKLAKKKKDERHHILRTLTQIKSEKVELGLQAFNLDR